MKKESKKNTGEKKIQVGIRLGRKDFGDTEFRDSLNKLDNNLKDIDTSLKDIDTKLKKL